MLSILSARIGTADGAGVFEPSTITATLKATKKIIICLVGTKNNTTKRRHGLTEVMSIVIPAETRETAASGIGTRAINRKLR